MYATVFEIDPVAPHLVQPDHPAFQDYVDSITKAKETLGPRAAADICEEILDDVSLLLEQADDGLGEAIEYLEDNDIALIELEHLGLWLDQQVDNLTRSIC